MESKIDFYPKLKKGYYQSPDHFSYFTTMREQKLLCDLTIEAETQLFPVHRCIMVGTIEYFRKMLMFKENNEEIISLKNITAKSMKALIDYAYTGKITLTEDTVENLMRDADYLLISEIKEACEKFLELILCKENAYKIYCIAEELSCIALKVQSHTLMVDHILDIVQTKEYLEFDHSCIISVVTDNKLLSPTTEFEAVMRWVISDFEERKIHLSEILSCSNLFELSLEYLNDYIFKEDVITAISELEHKDLVVEVLLIYRKLKEQKPKNEPKEYIAVIKGGDHVNSMDIYNSNKNRWISIETTGAESDLFDCTEHENRIYKITGKNNFVIQFYDLQQKIWETIPSTNIPPLLYAGIVSLDEHLYVCGGLSNSQFMNTVLRYSPATNEWRWLSSMNTSRYCATVVALYGSLYAIGGYNIQGNLDSVERYDPKHDIWTTISPLQNKRFAAGAAILNGKIFICGGKGESISNSVEVYDPLVNRWVFVAPMKVARYSAFVVAHAGKIWAFGGRSEKLEDLSSVEVYDIENDSWSVVSAMPTLKGDVCGGILLI